MKHVVDPNQRDILRPVRLIVVVECMPKSPTRFSKPVLHELCHLSVIITCRIHVAITSKDQRFSCLNAQTINQISDLRVPNVSFIIAWQSQGQDNT